MCRPMTVLVLLTAGLVPALVAAPVPAGAEKLAPPTRAELMRSENNLKQIGLAFHNHEAAFQFFPNNVYDKDGKGLLSWRVAILPFLEEDTLYQQFKLDEPWDGPTNKTLIGKMPKVYAPIRVKAKDGETFYRGFAGRGAPFGPDKGKGVRIAAFTDGTANTGLVYEAAEPVVWTRPDDLPLDEKKDLPKLGGLFDGPANVVLADGSVTRLRANPDAAELRKLIGHQDGEVIDLDKLTAK